MTKDQKITFYVFLLAVALILWKIYVLYFGMRLYGFLVPPGGDPANHVEMISEILQGHFNSQYPPLFHSLIAFLSLISGIEPLNLLNYITPILVVLPPIGIYIFLRQNVSRTSAVFGFVLTLLSSSYGLVAYGDGNYPNILAAGFFMPIAFSYIARAFTDRSKKNIVLSLVFMILTILTHHLTTALFLLIFVVYIVVLIIWNNFEQITPRLNKVVYALVGCLVLSLLVVYLTPVKEVFSKIISSMVAGGSALGIDSYAQIPTLEEIASSLGGLPFYFGLASLAFLFAMLFRDKVSNNKPVYILVLVWFLVVLGLAHIKAASLPARIAREAGIPLLIGSGIFFDELIKSIRSLRGRVILAGAFAVIICLSVVQINAGAYRAPGLFTKMIWFWPRDKEKTDYVINNLPEGSVTLANASNPYLKIFSNDKIEATVYAKEDGSILAQINKFSADYLLILNSAKPNPFEENRKADENVKEKMLSYAMNNKLKVVHVFADGSIIYKTNKQLTSE